MDVLAGVDEAGRGPLVGPVVAAAVVFPSDFVIPSTINDSKKLSAKKRESLFDEIIASAQSYAIAEASAAEIDELNIHHATLLAMRRALDGLSVKPSLCLIDGKFVPHGDYNLRAIIGGDASEPVIGAASILAKVSRDQQLIELDAKYPAYGFAKHKGYPTKEHLQALAEYGPTPYHRMSFKPLKK